MQLLSSLWLPLYLLLHLAILWVTVVLAENDHQVCDEYSDFVAVEVQYKQLAEDLLDIVAHSSSHNNKNDGTATNNIVVLSDAQDSSQIRNQNYKRTYGNKQQRQLSMQNLTRILAIDPTLGTVRVQARVTFDKLVQSTVITYGCVPAVVPEFKSITVGGAIVGGALESSSFRYGQVSDTVLSAIVLLANGTVTQITTGTESSSSSQDHNELYHALPGSYGTLGIVLEATLRLNRCKDSIVKVTTTSYPNTNDGVAALLLQQQDHDFMDALQFPNTGNLVVCAGDYVNRNDTHHGGELTRLSHSSSPWYYELIQDRQYQSHTNDTMYFSVYDYLFRYERGAFWMARPMQFRWKEVFKNPMLIGPFLASWRKTRWIFGGFFTATKLYRLLHKADDLAVAETMVILDAYMPASKAALLIDYVRAEIPLTTPIWLCPVKPPTQRQPLSPSGGISNEQFIINVGVYGRVSDRRAIEYTRLIEHKIVELGGRKMLYSQTSMTADELYTTHIDGKEYQRLRDKYNANGVFAPLHEKLQLKSSSTYSNNTTRKCSLKYWVSRLLL